MNKPITNYTNRARKLAVQKEIYDNITKKTFVGLSGPNVIQYLDKINYKRFKRVTLYEKNKRVFTRISNLLGKKYPTVKVVNKDINLYLGRTKAFYDLDYCKSFEDIRRYLPKICKIEEFSMTLSIRKVGYPPFKVIASHLGHSAFKHYPYRDGNPMITISISKTNWH